MNRFELIVGVHSFAEIADLEDAHPDEPLKLAVAAWLPELSGAFSEKQLRSAIDAGQFEAELIGRRLYVTRAGIARWRQDARVNRRRGIVSAPATMPDSTHGAREAARQAVEALRRIGRR